MPEDYYSYSGFTFLASPRGELFLALERQIMTFDVGFDGDYFDYAGAQHLSSRDRRLARSNPR
jgi:hypothetical protein